MNHDEIKKMAREAGYYLYHLTETQGEKTDESDDKDQWAQLARFAALVAAKEREACAQLVSNTKEWKGKGFVSFLCPDTNACITAAIRARE